MKDRYQYLAEHNQFAKLLPVVAFDYEKKVFLLEDGYIGVGIIGDPLPGVTDNLENQLEPILTADYPADSMVSISLISSPNILKHKRSYLGMRGISDNPFVQKQIEEEKGELSQDLTASIKAKAAFMEESTHVPVESNTGLMVRDFKVLITLKVPVQEQPPSEKMMDSLSTANKQILQILKMVGMRNVEELTAKSWVQVMQGLLNWDDEALWRTDNLEVNGPSKTEPLNEQVLDWGNEINVEKDHLKIGDKHVGVMSVHKWPKAMRLDLMTKLIGDVQTGSRGVRDNFMVTLNLHLPNKDSLKRKMERKRQKVLYQAFGPMLKWVPKLADQKYSFDYLFEKLDDGSAPVRAYLEFVVFSDSEEKLKQTTSAMRSLYQEVKFYILGEKAICLPMFLQSLPLCQNYKIANQFSRYKTFASSQAVHLMPIISDWKGSPTPMLQFVSRNGQVMSMDLFDSLTNFNCSIAAKSGAGKSFLVNEIILSYLSQRGNRFWMVDVGRSYEKLCESIGGQFIVFDETAKFSLNPYAMIEEYEDEKSRREHSDMLLAILGAMASPKDQLTELQHARLAQIQSALWAKLGAELTITHIAEACLKDDDQRVRDLGTQLFQFTDKGDYGDFFSNKYPPLEFDNPFVVLELEELKGKKHLQQVVLLTLISRIQYEMYLGSREHRKVFALDEAWDLLSSSEQVARFIESGYRRFRKYNAAAITITQSINDLYNSPAGAAIAENSSNFFLLAQKAEAIESFKKSGRLSFSDGVFDWLKSVHTIPGSYSEIFFYNELGMGIGRLFVERQSQLLYSTKAEDINAIAKYTRMGYGLLDAINAVVEEERGRKLHDAA